MLSLLFYLIIILVIVAIMFLFYYQRRQKKRLQSRKLEPLINFNPPDFAKANKLEESEQSLDSIETSPYDPNLVVLHVNAFSGKPYMGYELHQALLSANLRFGEMGIFHRYADGADSKPLFSLAAATPSGSFAIEDMGSFKCNGLLLFMRLDPKQKLMTSFDLMLDTARQLTEELGGEIYDDLHQVINVEVLKRLREKICMVETNNLYVSDLLDNLD